MGDEETAMDQPQTPLPKAVDSVSTTITITGLVLSLPFAISLSNLIVSSIIIEVANIDLQVEAAADWVALATLLQWSTFCFFFPALPGGILAITGFVMRRTRLASITLLVAAAPWFLFALYVVVIYFFFPELLV